MVITRYSQLVMPQDANVVGTLFGGQMVSWMDIAEGCENKVCVSTITSRALLTIL